MRWGRMPRKTVPSKVIRVYHREDGRYVSRNEMATDSPLGVDATLNAALGTAKREATLASREGYPVRIEVQDAGGKWREVETVKPPRF